MSKYTKNELIKKLKRSLIDIEAWSGPNAGDDVWEAIDMEVSDGRRNVCH